MGENSTLSVTLRSFVISPCLLMQSLLLPPPSGMLCSSITGASPRVNDLDMLNLVLRFCSPPYSPGNSIVPRVDANVISSMRPSPIWGADLCLFLPCLHCHAHYLQYTHHTCYTSHSHGVQQMAVEQTKPSSRIKPSGLSQIDGEFG